VRYAGGLPLWHVSISRHEPGSRMPVPVLRWSPTAHRKAEAIRDRITRGLGNLDQPWFQEIGAVAVHYRRPLRLDEINQLAQTPDVQARQGRP
jgi:hypothetical protein